MAQESERLKREIAGLEKRRDELSTKQSEAAARIAEIEQRRQSFLAEAGEGNTGARRELKKLDTDRQDAATDHEALSAAHSKVTRELQDVQALLAGAERLEAIRFVETEIAALGQADGVLEEAVAGLKAASAALFAAGDELTGQLAAFDPVRWGPAFASEIKRDIAASITRQLDMLGKPPGWPIPPKVFELIAPRFKAIIAQLQYESGQWHSAGQGEKLYRTLHHLTGIRQVDLPLGAVIALRPDEAKRYLESGALVLVGDEADVAPIPTEVPEPERPQRGERILNAGGF
jgi:hypothetical protein